jgi:hypothetical protein
MAKHNHLTTKFTKRVNATFSYRALLNQQAQDPGSPVDEVTKELALLPERFEDKKVINPKERKNKSEKKIYTKFLLKILIHASDIGNPCMPFDSYINWSILVTQEFNDQVRKFANKYKQIENISL